ncbi:Hypothetical protein BSSP2_II0685 [Brucella suis bv. 2]|uniref:Uncharacterized protein n=1 Tax=Brucella suis (strain ATCC 23445 / NCTC 10510) TaxID=470137 RepID=A9WZ31_BRUSI|nr:Hypothetical protein, conserved [Brucella suis ATCC 23445]AIB19377.1 Hypothetical protein BSSP3_II0688 [Brucella suis bv. 2]AIB22747.1 Hypothetical protein BSPT1_II0672 [Brucella suis bv. 2]AIB26104.1 Hypothetical protein BSPT2_II0674 [Brucella suis bv. 2]AIB29496.1 Hypothetical protein BSSP1_II0674 [Brucella suis bv. 2]
MWSCRLLPNYDEWSDFFMPMEGFWPLIGPFPEKILLGQ